MTKAKCFHCGRELPIGKTMEELLKIEMPVFCSNECADYFAEPDTKEFKDCIRVMKNDLI